MYKELPYLSIIQPSLNQCLISKKYYSEAIPELSHLSLPPGFQITNYSERMYYEPEISSSLSEQIFTKLINNIDPSAKIEIIKSKNTTKKKKSNKNKKKKTKKK